MKGLQGLEGSAKASWRRKHLSWPLKDGEDLDTQKKDGRLSQGYSRSKDIKDRC